MTLADDLRAARARPDFSLDWPHGFRTRNGKDVRILTMTDGPVTDPIVGVVEDEVHAWGDDGRVPYNSAFDLVNAPAPARRVKGWVAAYENGDEWFFVHMPLEATADVAVRTARMFATDEPPSPFVAVYIDHEVES